MTVRLVGPKAEIQRGSDPTGGGCRKGRIVSHAAERTAFVFAGGGDLGAVQVGMLRELMHAGVSADLVVGSSVGAINAAYFAGATNAAGVEKLEKVWRGLRRHDVFPVTFRSVLGFMGGADNLIDPSNLRRLIEHNIPFPNLEDAPIPVHVVATNFGGATVCLSSGPTVETLLASAAIPQPSHRFISASTISLMGQSGATSQFSTPPIWAPLVLSFSQREPLALSTSRQRGRSRELCMQSRCLSPIRWCVTSGSLVGKLMFSPYLICARSCLSYDFSRADQLIEQAAEHTRKWTKEAVCPDLRSRILYCHIHIELRWSTRG